MMYSSFIFSVVGDGYVVHVAEVYSDEDCSGDVVSHALVVGVNE